MANDFDSHYNDSQAAKDKSRRTFLHGAVAVGAASLAWPRWTRAAASDLDAIRVEIEKRHDESVKRLQEC